jgi:hypothetical protein
MRVVLSRMRSAAEQGRRLTSSCGAPMKRAESLTCPGLLEQAPSHG